MSQIPAPLQLTEEDVKAFLACGAHIGNENLDATMTRYVHKRNASGIHIIDIRKTWEKIVLAARVIVAIENAKDICVVALSPAGSPSPAQRAVMKFATNVGCRSIAGRMSPGTFTNHRQAHFMEPRLLITSDPRVDHQPIIEASYVNIPIISFVNTHHNLRGIDIAIPINTSGKNSVALGYWMLAREVLRLRQTIARDREWDVMVDMFIYRDPEESAKQIADTEHWESKQGWAGEGTFEGDQYDQPGPEGVVPEEYGEAAWGDEGAVEADWGGEATGETWGAAGEW